MYGVPLDTTDTNTLGTLWVGIHESGALHVWREFMVVPANVWDSMFSTDKLQVDMVQIAGTTQDATDLGDFAAAGYDPGTNKVQGVVLTDTCTTNTDLVTAAAIRTEMDSNSTELAKIGTIPALDGAAQTIGAAIGKIADDNGGANFDATNDSLERIANTAPLGTAMRGTDSAALASVCTEGRLAELDAGNIPADLDAALADTNELQGDWTNGGRLDLIIDAILADTNELQGDWTDSGRLDLIIDAILADSNELQADWVNGGRLDTLLDSVVTKATAIQAKTDNLPTGVQKNVGFTLTFFMVDSTDDKTGKTGLTVTATRSIDSAAFGACANAVTEIASGFYKIVLANADVNGDFITLLFTAAGANARTISFKTSA
jgi:hypothetical protein